MESSEVLAIVGGHVEEEILLRNEYLAAENEILKSKLGRRLRFTDEERVRLAKIGKRLGRKALAGFDRRTRHCPEMGQGVGREEIRRLEEAAFPRRLPTKSSEKIGLVL